MAQPNVSTQTALILKRQGDQVAKPTQADSFPHSQGIRQMPHPDPPMPKSRRVLILYRTYVSHRSTLGCMEADSGLAKHILKRTNTPILPPKMRTSAPSEDDLGNPETGPSVASGRTTSDAVPGRSENVVPGARDKRWIFQIWSCQFPVAIILSAAKPPT